MLILFTFDKIVKIPQAVEVMNTTMPKGFDNIITEIVSSANITIDIVL